MRRSTGAPGRVIGPALLAAVLSLGCGLAARAENGAYTAPPKGFRITWTREINDGGKVTRDTLMHSIIASKGDEVVYKVEEPGGDEVRLLRGIFSYAVWRPERGWAEHRFDKAAIRGLWPLEPGKQATVAMRYGYGLAKTQAAAQQKWAHTETGSIHYTVLRRERVATPAGTFDAFVIQRDRHFTRLADKRTVAHRRIGWFAPKLGYVVKQVVIYEVGNPKSRRMTLAAAAIKQPGK
jgi:hypothetical protein